MDANPHVPRKKEKNEEKRLQTSDDVAVGHTSNQ